jgi:UDP-glucose 4-epimerase
VVGDVRDRKAVRRLTRDADVVVHLAAFVHRPTRSEQDREECWSVNVDGTRNVVKAVSAEASKPFLIFVSTTNVYGPSDSTLDEESSCRPQTEYARSKLEAERLVLEAVRTGSLSACVIRPSMVFGPGGPGNLRRLIRMVDSGLAVVADRGLQRKSLVPVETLNAAIQLVALKRTDTSGQLLNVSGGEPMTIRQIIDTLAHARGVRARVVAIPAPLMRYGANVLDRLTGLLRPGAPGMSALAQSFISSSVVSQAKIHRLLSFEEPISPKEALARMGSPPDHVR